jgi:hypothetical protein
MAFNFFKPKSTQESSDVTRQPRRSSGIVDFTNSYQANIDLTRGLYHNTYPGFKLAGGLAYAPIAIPVWFMGLPIPTSENEADQEILNEIILSFAMSLYEINIQTHRDGTVWVWPRWSSRAGKLIWEFIPDDTVTDIITDLETGEIVEIIANEDLKISIGENRVVNAQRKRSFTEKQITVFWSGDASIPGNLKTGTMRNALGIMPVRFTNNADGDEMRGHSDYERIIPDLKNYHDIDLALSTFLAKFSPKMVQNGVNLADWLANNGYESIADINIQTTDFIYNNLDEKTDFVFPDQAVESYLAKLKNIFQKIVEASGVPEIAWGLKTEGNRASVEENMAMLIKYVEDKRTQKNEGYKKLFAASLAIMARVNMMQSDSEIKIEWNKMDAVSDEVRSIIFRNYMQGISAAVVNAAITKEQLWKFYSELYPTATEDDFETFRAGLSDMGGHVQWTKENYTMARDLGDETDLSGQDQ